MDNSSLPPAGYTLDDPSSTPPAGYTVDVPQTPPPPGYSEDGVNAFAARGGDLINGLAGVAKLALGGGGSASAPPTYDQLRSDPGFNVQGLNPADPKNGPPPPPGFTLDDNTAGAGLSSNTAQLYAAPAGQQPLWQSLAQAAIHAHDAGFSLAGDKEPTGGLPQEGTTFTPDHAPAVTPYTASEKIALLDAYRKQFGGPQDQRTETGEQMAQDQAQQRAANVKGLSAGQNFASSAAEGLAQAGLPFQALANPDAALNTQQDISDAYANDPDRLSGFLGKTVGSTLPAVPAMLAPSNEFLQVMNSGVFAAQAAGNTRLEVAQRRRAGEEISGKQELAAAGLNALSTFAATKIGAKYSAVSQEAAQLSPGLASYLSNYANRIGVSITDMQAMQIAQNAIKSYTYAPDTDLTEGLTGATATGAILGGVTGLHQSGTLKAPAEALALPPAARETEGSATTPAPLPKLLEGVQPRYRVNDPEGTSRGVGLDFQSDQDKAAYIAGQPRKGKLSAAADQYLDAQGLSPEAKQSLIDGVRAHVDTTATAFKGGADEPIPVAPYNQETNVKPADVSSPADKPAAVSAGVGGDVPAVAPSKGGSPSEEVRAQAEAYTKEAGIPYDPTTENVRVDPAKAKRIADAYGDLEHAPEEPATAKSYDALKDETLAQYRFLQKQGVTFEPWTKEGQPYANSAEMMADVRDNKHLSFFTGGDLPSDHPMAEKAPGEGDLTYNDIFRAVHDYFGHAKEGNGFGPRGEENAWVQHSQMYSDEARPAMTTETRGQNSYVNYGPNGEANRANPAETQYAPQKAGLLPDEFNPSPRTSAEPNADGGNPAFSPEKPAATEEEEGQGELPPQLGQNAREVEPTGPIARASAAVAKVLGINVVHVAGADVAGFSDGKNVYISTDRPVASWTKVFAHEWMHNVQSTDPETAKAFYDAIPPELREKYEADYREKYQAAYDAQGPDGPMPDPAEYFTKGKVRMEVGAEAMADAATRGRVRRAMLGEQAGLWDKIVDAGESLRDRLTGKSAIVDAALDTLREKRSDAGSSPAPDSDASFAPKFKDEENPFIALGKSVWEQTKKLGVLADRAVGSGTFREGAENIKGDLRESWARQDLQAARFQEMLQPALTLAKGMTEAQNADAIRAIEQGKPQPDSRFQPAADMIKRMFNLRSAQAQAVGVDTSKWDTNWLGRIFEWPGQEGSGKGNSIAGPENYLKARTYDTYDDALAAVKASGGRPVFDNFLETALAKHQEIAKSVEGRQTFNDAAVRGDIAKFGGKEKLPEGWTYLSDKLATRYGPPSFVKDTSPTTGLTRTIASENVQARYAAPDVVAHTWNDTLAKGMNETVPFWKQWTQANRIITAVNLGLSGFHALNIASGGMMMNIAQAADNLSRGEFTLAGKNILRAATAPITNVIEGSMIRRQARDPLSNPGLEPKVQAIAEGGGRFDNHSVLDRTDWYSMQKAWNNGQYVKAPALFAKALWGSISAPLFDRYIPNMKAGLLAQRAETEIARGSDLRETMQRHSDLADNLLGHVVQDNKFQNKVVSDFLQGVVMAPGWNEGLLRAVGGTARDYGKLAISTVQALQGKGQLEARPNVFLPLGGVLATMASGAAVHYFNTGGMPTTMQDYFQPKSGRKDDDGNDIRYNVPSPLKDVPALLSNPQRTAWNKSVPLIRMAYEVAKNSDYRGTQVYNPDDTLGQKAASLAKYAGKAALPFSVETAANAKAKGSSTLGSILQGAAGLNQVPKSESSTPAQQKARDLENEAHPLGTRTQEAADHSDQVRKLVSGLRNGDPDARDAARQAVQSGQVRKDELVNAKGQLRPAGLQGSVQRLDMHDAMKVWDVASPAERQSIGPAVFQKLRQSRAITQEQRKAYMQILERDWSSLKAGQAGEAEGQD